MIYLNSIEEMLIALVLPAVLLHLLSHGLLNMLLPLPLLLLEQMVLLLVIWEALFEVISLLTIRMDLSIHLLLRFLLFYFDKFLLFWFSLLFEKVITIFRFNQVRIQLLVFVLETLYIWYFHKFFWNEFSFC